MKLLLINNEYPPIGGGGSVLTSYIAKYLVKEGHEVKVLTSTFENLPLSEIVDGYEVIRTKSLRSNKGSSSYLELLSFTVSSIFKGQEVIKEFKPDIIQAYFAVPSGGTAYILSKMFHIPYSVYLGGSDVPGANPGKHGFIYPLITPIIKIILKNAKLVTACSDLLAEKVHNHLPNLKIVKIPNGVDTADFAPPKEKPKTPPLIILGVGRMMPRKGFQFLIDALGLIQKEVKNKFKLVLIGSGDYREELKQKARFHKIEKYIEFVDAVPYSELKKYYQQAHIFSLPSLAEGMPLAMLEGLSCGCALLTTDVAGNQELVYKNDNGFLVEPGNTKALADKLKIMLNDAKLVSKMGDKSRAMAIQYDWKKITAQYIQLYERIL